MRRIVIVAVLALAACSAEVPPAPRPAAAELAFAVPGRGAQVPFVEYEAEYAAYQGKLIGPDRTAKTLAGEASGRMAVTLSKGDSVTFELVAPANAITVRYSVPDGAEGTMTVSAGKALPLTSKYSWFYGAFPFTNSAGDGSPHHYYDHVRGLLDSVVPAGGKVTLSCECTVDLADFELVVAAGAMPAGAVSIVDFGADPTGTRDSSDAIQKALDTGDAWIPPGTFKVTRHLIANRTKLRGAGMWYSTLTGDGVGVYGNHSEAVLLSGFAIIGEVTGRDDKAQVNGIGGALGGGSIVEDLFIQHTKVGLWLDGPFSDLTVRGNRIFDMTADGLNLHQGISNTVVSGNVIRNTGDDGLAMWSDQDPNHHNVFRSNTVQLPLLANGIAIYGGHDNTIEGNVIADTLVEGAGVQIANRFSGTVPLSGTTLVKDNTVLRGGSKFPGIQANVGAFFVFGKDSAITGKIRLEGNTSLDSTFSGLHVYGARVSDLSVEGMLVRNPGSVGIQLQATGAGSVTKSRIERGVYLCHDLLPFTLTVADSTGLDAPKCEGI
jgi:hypothetical protein